MLVKSQVQIDDYYDEKQLKKKNPIFNGFGIASRKTHFIILSKACFDTYILRNIRFLQKSSLKIIDSISNFMHIEQEEKFELLQYFRYDLYERKKVLVKQNQKPQFIYIIIKGTIEVSYYQKRISLLNEFQMFGIESVFPLEKSIYTYTCQEDCEIIKLDFSDFLRCPNVSERSKMDLMQNLKENLKNIQQARHDLKSFDPQQTFKTLQIKEEDQQYQFTNKVSYQAISDQFQKYDIQMKNHEFIYKNQKIPLQVLVEGINQIDFQSYNQSMYEQQLKKKIIQKKFQFKQSELNHETKYYFQYKYDPSKLAKKKIEDIYNSYPNFNLTLRSQQNCPVKIIQKSFVKSKLSINPLQNQVSGLPKIDLTQQKQNLDNLADKPTQFLSSSYFWPQSNKNPKKYFLNSQEKKQKWTSNSYLPQNQFEDLLHKHDLM